MLPQGHNEKLSVVSQMVHALHQKKYFIQKVVAIGFDKSTRSKTLSASVQPCSSIIVCSWITQKIIFRVCVGKKFLIADHSHIYYEFKKKLLTITLWCPLTPVLFHPDSFNSSFQNNVIKLMIFFYN